MNEMVIAGAALAAVAVIAWVMSGAIARAALNAMQEKLAEFETLKAEHASTVNELRYEAERRAAAEVTAARVAGLERTVAERSQRARRARHAACRAEYPHRPRSARPPRRSSRSSTTRRSSSRTPSRRSPPTRSGATTRPSSSLRRSRWRSSRKARKGDLAARQQAVDELVKPLRESLGEGGRQARRNREGPHRRLRRAVHPGEGPRRKPPAGAAQRNRESVARAAPAARARALGRDPVEARGRDRRHAGALRLLRAGKPHDRGRAAAPRPDRAPARRQERGGGRQGAACRLSGGDGARSRATTRRGRS